MEKFTFEIHGRRRLQEPGFSFPRILILIFFFQTRFFNLIEIKLETLFELSVGMKKMPTRENVRDIQPTPNSSPLTTRIYALDPGFRFCCSSCVPSLLFGMHSVDKSIDGGSLSPPLSLWLQSTDQYRPSDRFPPFWSKARKLFGRSSDPGSCWNKKKNQQQQQQQHWKIIERKREYIYIVVAKYSVLAKLHEKYIKRARNKKKIPKK